mmetsp:Transcript_25912/g.55705  ORF Transcript_25912/g.55705 Transcript_25912/m.55705 type:complete len:81 (-) Transcript_25912:51-293(-)
MPGQRGRPKRPKKSAAEWQQELSDVMSSLDEDGWKRTRAEYSEYRKLYRKTVGLSKDNGVLPYKEGIACRQYMHHGKKKI